MDKDLSKILNRAKQSEPVLEEEKPIKVFPKNGPYDYLVFTQLVRFAGFQKFIFLIALLAIISIGFFFDGLSTWVIYVLIAYAILITFVLFLNYYRYHFQFKGWQERLPFTIEGWNEMIYDKKMFCDLCWNHTRIEIILSNSTPDLEELIAASLKLFSKKTKRAFYSQDMHSPSTLNRNDWKLVSTTVAEGSANPQVMRYMKNLFQQELSTIAKKTGKIKSVKVTLLSEEFSVKYLVNYGN